MHVAASNISGFVAPAGCWAQLLLRPTEGVEFHQLLAKNGKAYRQTTASNAVSIVFQVGF
jgi:gas vesicle protein